MTNTYATRRLCSLLIAGALVFLAGSSVQANQEATAEQMTISKFSFSGGTVEQYVTSIRKTFPDANIVIDERSADFTVPPMQLESVNISALLWLVEDMPGTWENMSLLCTVDSYSQGPGISAVYRISTYRDPSSSPQGRSGQQRSTSRTRMNTAPAPTTTTSVNSVARTVELGMTPDDIISALKLTLKVNGHDVESTTITYHEPTRLMIINGTLDATDLTVHVLDEISTTASILHDKEARTASVGDVDES